MKKTYVVKITADKDFKRQNMKSKHLFKSLFYN